MILLAIFFITHHLKQITHSSNARLANPLIGNLFSGQQLSKVTGD